MKKDLAEQTDTPGLASNRDIALRDFMTQSHPIAIGCLLLSLAFLSPLSHMWRLATHSDLYSHTLLIPLVSIYLAWDNRNRIQPSQSAWLWSLLPLAIGSILLVVFFMTDVKPTEGDELETYLSVAMGAYVSIALAIIIGFSNRHSVSVNLFPILFLIFLIPFPAEVKVAIQTFFQYASAEAAYWFIKLSGIPIFRTGLIFQMPEIDMEVAPQCSGIRSTLVLLITSLVGSYLFLKSNWRRATIVFLIIPLGIFRNGIRIFILAQLCHQYGYDQIHGWFHKQGGQPLFVVTLIPLFALLYWFWKSEQKQNTI